MPERRMFRYAVAVDDRPHFVYLTGDPLHVGCQYLSEVEFWAENDPDDSPAPVAFQVFGTGQPIPDGAVHVGTCPRLQGLVWHLYRLPGEG